MAGRHLVNRDRWRSTMAGGVASMAVFACTANTASDPPRAAAGTAGGGGSVAGAAPVGEVAGAAAEADAGSQAGVPEQPRLCVFDYDLTLSSHHCEATAGVDGYACRINTCGTYGWYGQCLGLRARYAVAQCVARGAYIGIASHAPVDDCWEDKVIPILTDSQFPELTTSPHYDARGPIWAYPALDDRSHWNCADCAYQMDGTLSKPDGIRRIMVHYGLDPGRATDRARVIFWDDTQENIDAVRTELPEARAVLVPRHGLTGAEGGCGIAQAQVGSAWSP